jgi:protease-4
MGSQAKDNGLIDELGGIDKALDLVKRKANIGADEKIRLVPYPGRKTFFEQFMKVRTDTSAEARLLAKFREMTGVDLRTLSQGGIMKLMPYSIKVE